MTMKSEVIHRRGAENAEFAEKEVTEAIIASAIEVHRHLGLGLLESTHQRALQHELGLRLLPFRLQDHAQLLSYLRLTGFLTGLLVNFNRPLFKQGIRRVSNSLLSSAPSAPLR